MGEENLTYLALPGCLNFFQNGDGKCEHSIKAAQPLLLEWLDRPSPFILMKDAFATHSNFAELGLTKQASE